MKGRHSQEEEDMALATYRYLTSHKSTFQICREKREGLFSKVFFSKAEDHLGKIKSVLLFQKEYF